MSQRPDAALREWQRSALGSVRHRVLEDLRDPMLPCVHDWAVVLRLEDRHGINAVVLAVDPDQREPMVAFRLRWSADDETARLRELPAEPGLGYKPQLRIGLERLTIDALAGAQTLSALAAARLPLLGIEVVLSLDGTTLELSTPAATLQWRDGCLPPEWAVLAPPVGMAHRTRRASAWPHGRLPGRLLWHWPNAMTRSHARFSLEARGRNMP